MKASEALQKLTRLQIDSEGQYLRSKVDETKTLSQMLEAWLNLFETFPHMRVGSIILYNVNKDFDCL